MTDSKTGKPESHQELEWQKRFELPEEFRGERIPGYFRDRGAFIRIGISLRTRRGKVDPAMPAGIAYYPIGVAHAYTGNSVSVTAPFAMDANRSELVDPSNSGFNAWLHRLAADMTVELLRTDWFYRFGVVAYRAAGEIDRSALRVYSEAVERRLKSDPCWPSRSGSGRTKETVQFASIGDLNMVASPSLDGFLENRCYLHSNFFCATPVLYQLAKRYGAKEFTVNSLVRLRCAGKESNTLRSVCKENEANYYFTEFPECWKNLFRQRRCAAALDEHRGQLSKENRCDLAESATTITESNSLDAAASLWFIPGEILDVCPVLEENRLHPELSQSRVLRSLCKSFNVAHWIEDVIGGLENDDSDERERISLYRYLVSVHGRVPRRLSKVVRNSPVFRDHDGNWVPPKAITALGTNGIRQFHPALHLPHRDYAKDTTLAKALRFKGRITEDDVVRFAELVSAQPDIAQEFERVLERSRGLLTARTIRRLLPISFVCTNEGELRPPSSIYLDTPRNRACIGPSGPYPIGNAKKLFSRLGCHARPKEERIMEYLADLRQNDEPPPRPEILYPELVGALKRESVPITYQDEEILWTEKGYSAPAHTILGGRWNKVLLGCVPIINTSNRTLRRAYRDLGVHDQPQSRHWEYFFVSLGEKYRQEPCPLTARQRSAIRMAYLQSGDIISLSSDIPWLLDEDGHLHTTTDAGSGRFVIENDVPLGSELRRLNAPIAFADNSNPNITSFFRRLDVKLLTEIRTKGQERVGASRLAPKWFREDEYVRRLVGADFRSALEAVAGRDFPKNSDVLEQVRRTLKRLEDLESVVFVDNIVSDYHVRGKRVEIGTKYAWTGNYIYLTWVRSKAGLEGVLASLLAGRCLPDGLGDHARFSDSIFRLIACQTSRDLREYLEQRGIRWRPLIEDEDHGSEDYLGDVEEAIRAAVWPRNTSSMSEGLPCSRDDEPAGYKENPDSDATEPLTLPPIEAVNARIVQPSSDWSYSPGPSGGSWGGGGGWSPGNRSAERDRLIGRRGEEVVFMLEKARVRRAGFREDRVVWVSEANPASDHDIESVDDDGEKLFIEVKATTGSDGKFHWSVAEFHRALQAQSRYILYRVYFVNDLSPVVCAFRNPVSLISSGGLHLDIDSFRAEVQPNGSNRNT